MKEFITHLYSSYKEGALDLFFFDESYFSLTPNIPYTWQPIGETICINSSRSKMINILGFINPDNKCETYQVTGSVTSKVVIACFDDFIEKNKTKNPLFIIVDNAPTHTSNAFKDKMEQWAEKDCYIIFLPPYSPELNIIEILWRFIKYQWLKSSAYESFKSLQENIDSILSQIGTKYCINFFKEKNVVMSD